MVRDEEENETITIDAQIRYYQLSRGNERGIIRCEGVKDQGMEEGRAEWSLSHVTQFHLDAF